MDAEAAVVVAVASAAAGLFAYWAFVFARLLPLERQLAAERRVSAELAEFARAVARLGLPATGSPAALNDAGRGLVELLSERMPGVALAWVALEEGDKPRVVAQKGQLFGSALRRGWSEEELRAELARAGACAVAVLPWGRTNGSRGFLAAADLDARGRRLQSGRVFLEVAASAGTTLAGLADALASLSQARQKLEGGLSTAMHELEETHTRLIRKSREARTLHDVVTTMTSRPSQDALSAVVGIVARYLDADRVAFLLLDEATGELVTQPGAYGVESQEQLYRVPLTQEGSSSVRAFKTGKPFMTGDAQNDPKVFARYARLWDIHSLMVLPIRRDGRPVGVLRVGSKKKDFFTAEQFELMRVIADEAAVLVETVFLNKRLSESAEQLKALNRMKDEFVSTVSHEFKTPLTTLMGFLTVMLEGDTGPLSEQQMRFLNMSKNAVKRLAAMVSELLDLSKLEGNVALDAKPVRLEEILAASVEAHRPQADEHGKSISLTTPADLPPALGDHRWLGVVVDNLLSNALKFTRKGGRVELEAADRGDFVQVTVKDDGVGIGPADAPRIFEKFYRASNNAELGVPGTGLGLAISRQVIAKHGGRIWFESEPGKGSSFHFVVPVSRAREAVA